MLVSVIVCTNRPHRLPTLLESACGLVVPAGLAWELLVVDNGGGAAAAAAPFACRLPLRVVNEPRSGLCLARNCGVREAKGRYLCWTDDDVLLDPSWLSAYAQAFARHPEAALFGGRILPRLEEPASPLFRGRLLEWPLNYVVAHRDMGDEESPISARSGLPWGANFAVRAEEQARHLYNVELGFSPHHRRTGEETDVGYRILRAGGEGWWVPEAKVEHLIPPERQTRAHVAQYYNLAGHTAAFLHDRFPGDHSLAGFGPLPFARFGTAGLGLAASAARLLAGAFSFAGMTGASLRYLARHSYYRGIAAHLRERRAEAILARRLPEARRASG